MTIFLADDDLEDLELVEDSIKKREPGANIIKFQNGKAVLEYIAQVADADLPCLIILDYNMPEIKGPEVLEQLCREPRYLHIPKIVLSTSNSQNYIDECLHNGAAEYLVKPTNWKDMAALSKKLLSFC